MIGPYENINVNGKSALPFEEGRIILFSQFSSLLIRTRMSRWAVFPPDGTNGTFDPGRTVLEKKRGLWNLASPGSLPSQPLLFPGDFRLGIQPPRAMELSPAMTEFKNTCHTSSLVLGTGEGTSAWSFSLSPRKHPDLCLALSVSQGQKPWQLLQLVNVSEP